MPVPNANNERKELTLACKGHLLCRNSVNLCMAQRIINLSAKIHIFYYKHKCYKGVSHHFTSHISLVSNISMKVW